MREMKDSGIASFGFIPDTWKVTKLKTILALRSEKNSGDRELLSVYLNSGVISYSDSTGMQVHKPSQDLSNYQNVYIGDFVLNNQQAWRGSVGVSNYDGIISPAYFVYKISESCHSRFMNYLLRDSSMVQQYENASRGVGTIQRNIFAPWLLESLIALPNFEEQKIIATYLDTRCAEIDTLVTDIQSQIEALEEYKRSVITEAVTKGLDPDVEMRDSGVDYIGKMNARWKLTKLRYICEKLNRYFTSNAEPLICSNKGEVFPRGENSFGLVSDNDKMFQGVHKGDLLIHGMDTWHGAIAVSDYDGKCTTVVHVCDSEQNKYFISYFLQMLAFKSVYKAISNGVRENTSDFRSWDKAGHIYITIPNIDEQNRIAKYIKEKVEHINAVIAEKKQQIETIEKYKKSLIFEYVTGKKEVQ